MGLFSAAAGIAGSLLGNSAARSAASKQNAWNVDNYKHRHQWETEDFEKAGLNRILSATNGAGSVASAGMADTTGGLGAGINSANAVANIKQQESATELNNSQAQLNSAQKLKTQKETGTIEPKAKAEIKNLNTQAAVNNAMISKVESDRELNTAVRHLKGEEKRKVKEEIKKIKGGKLTEYTGTADSKNEDIKKLDRVITAAKKIHDYATPIGMAKRIYKNFK